MLFHRWFKYVQPVVALGALLLLAACSPVTTTQTGGPADTATPAPPTATATPAPPTATPTLTSPTCGSNFTSTTYVTTLPDSNYQKTNIYAQVQLPPLTRSFDNDAAGGLRGRALCSAGTTASVLAFMQTHLTSLGWQPVNMSTNSCVDLATFGQQQCWQNGAYTLTLGMNTNTDWIIAYRDPDFA